MEGLPELPSFEDDCQDPSRRDRITSTGLAAMLGVVAALFWVAVLRVDYHITVYLLFALSILGGIAMFADV